MAQPIENRRTTETKKRTPWTDVKVSRRRRPAYLKSGLVSADFYADEDLSGRAVDDELAAERDKMLGLIAVRAAIRKRC